MLRLLNIVAICALIGSAVYAYSIKYQTAYRAEQIAKTRIEIKQERDAIAVLRAEWAYMTRPERLQPLADKYLPDLRPLQVTQIVAATSLPQKTHSDFIGAKLSEIGLSLPATPAAAPATPTTPKSDTPKAKAATPKVAATTKAPSASQQSPSREQKKP
ncbi:cell division protein FtsL [Methylocystis sp. JAN1]|uniref:cell division protein FtsL n=1 Tax=Methylocystis sp. JAN1 TaxID=3397211 RepID=UPI003FA2458A